jgi:hypothetical protein
LNTECGVRCEREKTWNKNAGKIWRQSQKYEIWGQKNLRSCGGKNRTQNTKTNNDCKKVAAKSDFVFRFSKFPPISTPSFHFGATAARAPQLKYYLH